MIATAIRTAEALTIPSFQYRAMAPVLIVLVAGVVSVVVEAIFPRAARRALQLVLVMASLVAALILTITMPPSAEGVVAAGSLAVDGPTLFLWMAILVVALLAALVMAEKRVDPAGDAFAPRAASLVGSAEEQELTRRGWDQSEVWALFLFAVSGMLLFPAANDLLMLFVALEVMSLPLYLLAGMARRRRLLSQEAALKYFLLGAFASALMLYGSAMLFGYAGALDFASISEAFTNNPGARGLQLIGIALVSIGLLFKVAAVPFHMWTPDVYQGSPTPVTAFMAAAVKVAGFGALLRVMYVALGGAWWDWRPVMWVVAILTMLVGVMLAVTSSDIKRMLAYSSVGHAGFLLLGVIAFSTAGLAATMFYLLAYGLTTVGCFAIVMLVRGPTGEAGHLSAWAGLGRTLPSGRRGLRVPAPGAGRHPADQRVHREVRRVLRRHRQRRGPAGHRRSAGLRDLGVLLPADHRADVLRQAGRRGCPRRRDAQRADADGHRRGGRRHPGAGGLPAGRPEPRERVRDLRSLTPSDPRNLRIPTESPLFPETPARCGVLRCSAAGGGGRFGARGRGDTDLRLCRP